MKYKRKKDKDFWVLARAYLHDYMPAVKNLSDKSVDAYKQSLKTYLSFLEEVKSLTEEKVTLDAFSRDNIKEYVTWLKDKEFSPKTINLRLTAIRSFLKYCSEEDFELRGIYTDVCSVKKVKEEKKAIQYLKPKATSAILSAYDVDTSKHRRNRMMLILLYDSGARVQELADLRAAMTIPNWTYLSLFLKSISLLMCITCRPYAYNYTLTQHKTLHLEKSK